MLLLLESIFICLEWPNMSASAFYPLFGFSLKHHHPVIWSSSSKEGPHSLSTQLRMLIRTQDESWHHCVRVHIFQHAVKLPGQPSQVLSCWRGFPAYQGCREQSLINRFQFTFPEKRWKRSPQPHVVSEHHRSGNRSTGCAHTQTSIPFLCRAFDVVLAIYQSDNEPSWPQRYSSS